MNRFVLKIKNLKEINQKLNKNKKKIFSKKVCNPVLKCNFVNAAMINFKGTHSKLFRHPCVQLERFESWLPVNIQNKKKPKKPKVKEVKKKLAQKPKVKKVKKTLVQKIKVTKRIFESIKGCYVFIWCHNRNSKGTYIRSVLDP